MRAPNDSLGSGSRLVGLRVVGCSTVPVASLEQALSEYIKPEELSGDNQYECEQCKRKTNASKGLRFRKFPYILCVQLERFAFDFDTMLRHKLDDVVTFPRTLDADSYLHGHGRAKLDRRDRSLSDATLGPHERRRSSMGGGSEFECRCEWARAYARVRVRARACACMPAVCAFAQCVCPVCPVCVRARARGRACLCRCVCGRPCVCVRAV